MIWQATYQEATKMRPIAMKIQHLKNEIQRKTLRPVGDMLKPSCWTRMMHIGLPPRSSGPTSSPWELETLESHFEGEWQACDWLHGPGGITQQAVLDSQPSAPQQSTPQKGSSWSASLTPTSTLPVLMGQRLQRRGMQTAAEPEPPWSMWTWWHQPKVSVGITG